MGRQTRASALACLWAVVLPVGAPLARVHTNVSKILPPIRVDSLSAADIAVHILATAKTMPNLRFGSHDYLRTRLIGGASSWGRDFPSLSYVFGKEDLRKAKAETGCEEAEAPEGFKRSTCADHAFSLLQLDNCTDEYYGGAGPCCRWVVSVPFPNPFGPRAAAARPPRVPPLAPTAGINGPNAIIHLTTHH